MSSSSRCPLTGLEIDRILHWRCCRQTAVEASRPGPETQMPAKGLGAASPRLILPSFYLRQKKLGNISLADSSSHPATNKRKDTITIQMKAKKLTVKRSGTKHTAAFLYDGDTLVASINRPFDDTQVERWVRLFKAAPDFLQACESVVAKWNPETG